MSLVAEMATCYRSDERHRRKLIMPHTADHLIDRISIVADVCGGRPCIRGLRLRVTDVLDLLAYGASRAEILADYPSLADEDISAALAYASRAVDHCVIEAA